MKFSMNSSHKSSSLENQWSLKRLRLRVPFEPKKNTVGELPTVTVSQGLTYPQFPSMNQLFYNYTELGKRGR